MGPDFERLSGIQNKIRDINIVSNLFFQGGLGAAAGMVVAGMDDGFFVQHHDPIPDGGDKLDKVSPGKICPSGLSGKQSISGK